MPIRSPDLLASYFRRIGYSGSIEPNLDTLTNLHRLHPATIAFESLDPFMGRPVRLDHDSLLTKLIGSRRGGYCHEHNLLFHDLLAMLGYRVAALGARVLWHDPSRDAPLSHRLTLIELPEGQFVADVGFGAQTPTAPFRLEPGLEQSTSHGTYRIMHAGSEFYLQMRLAERWAAMYRFRLEPLTPIDFEVANWYTSTHPRSRFTQNLIVSRVVGDRRVSLANRKLVSRASNGNVEERELNSSEELVHVLDEVMNLDLPAPAEELWSRVSLISSGTTSTGR